MKKSKTSQNIGKKTALKILIMPHDENLRLAKVMARDKITEEYAKLRDKASIEYNKNDFDFVLINDYCEENLKKNISTVVDFIEENLALMNEEISGLDTIYVRAGAFGAVSSSMVFELLRHNKNVCKYLPKYIIDVVKK